MTVISSQKRFKTWRGSLVRDAHPSKSFKSLLQRVNEEFEFPANSENDYNKDIENMQGISGIARVNSARTFRY
jgi:isocitrate dehydrogenase kinase/phosphatase